MEKLDVLGQRDLFRAKVSFYPAFLQGLFYLFLRKTQELKVICDFFSSLLECPVNELPKVLLGLNPILRLFSFNKGDEGRVNFGRRREGSGSNRELYTGFEMVLPEERYGSVFF